MLARNELKALFLAGSAGFVVLAAPAFAQNAEDEAAKDGELVVTAQKRTQSVKDIPFTVNAVGQEQLANAAVTDVFSLQSQVPVSISAPPTHLRLAAHSQFADLAQVYSTLALNLRSAR